MTHLKRNFIFLTILLFVFNSSLIANAKQCGQRTRLLTDSNSNYQFSIDKNTILTNNECWGLIETSEDYGVIVSLDKFHTKLAECPKTNSTESERSCCNYLEIGTGSTIGQDIEYKFCAGQSPKKFTVNSNDVWIKYTGISLGLNLKATFDVIKLVYRSNSGQISNFLGKISKDNYFNNMNLTYKIIGDENSLIYFNFQTLDTEMNETNCVDYVKIGGLDGERAIGKSREFCGDKTPAPFYLNSSTAYVQVTTDSSLLLVGFKLTYEVIKNVFTESKGSINSNDKKVNLTYKITAPKNKRVELTFNQFKFGSCSMYSLDENASNQKNLCSTNTNRLIVKNYQVLVYH